MAFVHEDSCLCSKSETDLFTVPPTQRDILDGQFLEFKPLNTISSSGPLEFAVSGQTDRYMDLSQTLLHVKAKITKPNGTNLDADEDVGPINLFLHSLFSQIDVHLNDRMISVPNNTYPYRAYLETLLSYGPAAKESQLTNALFYKDRAGKFDVASPVVADDDANTGLKKRYQFTEESKVVDMMGPLHTDVTFMDRLLLNNVDVKFKLHRIKDEFCLMTSGNPALNYKTEIMDATLYIRSVKVNPTTALEHAKLLESGRTAKYPFRHVDVKSVSIPRGNLNFIRESLFQGQVPRRLILGLVDNDAYSGSYNKNPFNFKHNKVNYLSLHCNGESIPWRPLRPKFGDDSESGHILAYQTLFQGTNIQHKDQGIQIDREDYVGGTTLYAFDLTPDASDGGHLNAIQQGAVSLELQFAEALTSTVNLVVYSEWDSIFEVTKSRSILLDYKS